MDSDEEEDTRSVPKPGTVHYGSLEETERERISQQESPASKTQDESEPERKIKKREETGVNIHRSAEYLPLEKRPEKDEKQAVLEEFERRKRARQIQVSTDDAVVKQSLRDLDQSICLFGEGPGDRRNRLRDLLSRIGTEALEVARKQREGEKGDAPAVAVPPEENVTWYHEGPESLREARIWMARYSIPRARERLRREKEEKASSEAIRNSKRQELQKKLTSLAPYCSQIGDTRPISFCHFNPTGEFLATASWSGLCQVWSIPRCESVRKLRGHQGNVTCVTFNPDESSRVALASSGTDGSVKLWDQESEDALVDLQGYHGTFRVSRVRFHPSGRLFVTCVSDNSWRLWDLESQQELLHQEGHSGAVHECSLHPDGSLLVTGAMDSYGRLWDLRTGQCVMLFSGHLKSVLGVDFSPNGHVLATGSEDDTCKIWDIRKRACVYTIPAHTSLVSCVRFEPNAGKYLVTTSYDRMCKIWLAPFWQPLKTLSGHDGKVMCCDVTPKWIATSAFDRTFKLWAPED